MALETTVVYPQDPFGNIYSYKDFYSSAWGHDYILQQHENQAFEYNNNNNTSREQGNFWDESSSSVMQNVKECWDPNSSPEACTGGAEPSETPAATVVGRRKRRRTRSSKNKEELESQRMTHIAVERNRRKQMNEYLAAIRSMMPPSYVQRGDQASIIGGAINFVKELEQQLQTIEAQKRANEQQKGSNINNNNVCGSSPLFGDFFTYPQYSTRTTSSSSGALGLVNEEEINGSAAFGDIEVTMVECHANLKILSKKRPKQLLKIVAGLQCLWLTILHLNVTTTADQMVLYTISVKLEEGCQLTTVEDIADFVNHLLGRIEEESVLS